MNKVKIKRKISKLEQKLEIIEKGILTTYPLTKEHNILEFKYFWILVDILFLKLKLNKLEG